MRYICYKEKNFGTAAMDPEGIIVWHHASRSYFKVLLKNDDKAKGEQ